MVTVPIDSYYDYDHDLNDDKEWSAMDIDDLEHEIAYGRSIEEAASFLRRTGNVEDVRQKAKELGLLR